MSTPAERMRSNFAYFDRNSDDFITISEELGSFRRGWATQYDADGDGRLSFSEFLATAPAARETTAGGVTSKPATTTGAPAYRPHTQPAGQTQKKLPAQPSAPKISQTPVAPPTVSPVPKREAETSPKTPTDRPAGTVSPPKSDVVTPAAPVSPPDAQSQKGLTGVPVSGNIDPSRPGPTVPVLGNIDPSRPGQALIAPFSDSKTGQQQIIIGDGNSSVYVGDTTTSNKPATVPNTGTNPEPDIDLYGDGTRRFDPIDIDLYGDGTRRFDPIEQGTVGSKSASFTRANYVN